MNSANHFFCFVWHRVHGSYLSLGGLKKFHSAPAIPDNKLKPRNVCLVVMYREDFLQE